MPNVRIEYHINSRGVARPQVRKPRLKKTSTGLSHLGASNLNAAVQRPLLYPCLKQAQCCLDAPKTNARTKKKTTRIDARLPNDRSLLNSGAFSPQAAQAFRIQNNKSYCLDKALSKERDNENSAKFFELSQLASFSVFSSFLSASIHALLLA